LDATARSWALSVTAVGAAAVEQKRSYILPSGDAATTINQFAGASGRPSRVIADVTVRF
jgi:hypothetical protein